MFFDRSMTNALTGDWPSRHPLEWKLINEKFGDSTVPRRTIKMYFMPRDMYAEINDGPLNRSSSRYYLDTSTKTVDFRRYWDLINKDDNYLMNGKFSYTINADTLILRNTSSSGTVHKMLFLRRIINNKR